ncbi:hypothetical protein [Actinospongicola halichondriae]|uniref:hypothetical protein n=1 Tax=Actinospongicola halichondriae TaxID=3236844 RepID=UPI003D4EB90F
MPGDRDKRRAVVEVLEAHDADDEMIAAGLLHDATLLGPGRVPDIKGHVGINVAAMVRGVGRSEPPSADPDTWNAQEDVHHDQVCRLPARPLYVAAAVTLVECQQLTVDLFLNVVTVDDVPDIVDRVRTVRRKVEHMERALDGDDIVDELGWAMAGATVLATEKVPDLEEQIVRREQSRSWPSGIGMRPGTSPQCFLLLAERGKTSTAGRGMRIRRTHCQYWDGTEQRWVTDDSCWTYVIGDDRREAIEVTAFEMDEFLAGNWVPLEDQGYFVPPQMRPSHLRPSVRP